jgi:hypothetical protein
MAKRPANPNTAYGRKRMRQEYAERKANMTPEERSKQNGNELVIGLVIVVLVIGILYMIGGPGAVMSWSRK